jgi:hypothetical protein
MTTFELFFKLLILVPLSYPPPLLLYTITLPTASLVRTSYPLEIASRVLLSSTEPGSREERGSKSEDRGLGRAFVVHKNRDLEGNNFFPTLSCMYAGDVITTWGGSFSVGP